jgi:class 3 adenylate cyclase
MPSLTAFLNSCKARLSRRIAFWIFVNFIVIEVVFFVPSVFRFMQRLKTQLYEVTDGKVQWIVAATPDASPEEFMASIEQLGQGEMIQELEGAVLYQQDSGQLLAEFGKPPELSFADITQRDMTNRWFYTRQHYDLVWFPDRLPGDYVLVIRHNAQKLQQELTTYALNITGIVLAIAVVITATTMIMMERLVIGRILRLRDRLLESGEAFSQDTLPKPEDYLIPVTRNDELSEVINAFNQSFLRTSDEMVQRREAEKMAQTEREKAEQLLLNILPAPIAEELKQGNHTIAEGYAEVTVLFADIVGFTSLSSQISPDELVKLLNQVFSTFDALSERYGLEKIKTIGDSYMVAGGLPIPNKDHVEAIANMALDMQRAIAQLCFPPLDALSLRIGIHTGPVVAGVIGTKKFIYDLWGDTVNIASRMESNGSPGQIQVTEATYELLKDQYFLEKRGVISVKGRGEMTTYWLRDRKLDVLAPTVSTRPTIDLSNDPR